LAELGVVCSATLSSFALPPVNPARSALRR